MVLHFLTLNWSFCRVRWSISIFFWNIQGNFFPIFQLTLETLPHFIKIKKQCPCKIRTLLVKYLPLNFKNFQQKKLLKYLCNVRVVYIRVELCFLGFNFMKNIWDKNFKIGHSAHATADFPSGKERSACSHPLAS